MKFSSVALAVAASIGLVACAGTETVYDESYRKTQIDGFYDDGAGGRDLKLIVFGNPFAIPQDKFARVVEEDLRDAPLTSRQETHPLLTPGPTAKPIYRLVYVFNPTGGLFGNAICRHGLKAEANDDFPPAAMPTPTTPTSHIVATAAFCVEYRAVTEVSGQVDAASPGDVQFYRLTRQMMAEVFRPDVHWDQNAQPMRNP